MAQKAVKNFSLSIKGILDIDDKGRLIACIEDRGEFDLAIMLKEFLGKECSISVKYDEDYQEPEEDIDPESGEILE